MSATPSASAPQLLESVGFEWVGHPHRMHTMRIAPELDGGITLVGGPWTTGDRMLDTITSSTEWTSPQGLAARVWALDAIDVEGAGSAEARWSIERSQPGSVFAVTSLSIESTSHPNGLNVAGFGTGVDTADAVPSAWLRVEAGKVPDRPERFESVGVRAAMSVVELWAQPDHDAVGVERLDTSDRTGAGFRPGDRTARMTTSHEVLGLAGWSWRVANTPKHRGRYLRGFRFAALPGGAEAVVSNRGEVTRPTQLELTVDLITRGDPDE